MPQTIARAERCSQDVSDGLRASFVTAGLPDCFWSFAAPCYAHLDNFVASEYGATPWFLCRGQNFGGYALPFG
eukprot:11214402-Lingulodinium_polyedra.AAC.1